MRRKKKVRPSDVHRQLRARMHLMNVNEEQLAARLGVSVTTLSNRLNGWRPWTSWEMYQVLKVLDLERWDLPVYFPPDGLEDGNGTAQGAITCALQREGKTAVDESKLNALRAFLEGV